MTDRFELTCWNCERVFKKDTEDDEIIGPYEEVKRVERTTRFRPEEIVVRREDHGFNEHSPVQCPACGLTRHKIQHKQRIEEDSCEKIDPESYSQQ